MTVRKHGDAGQAFPIYITVVAGLLFLAFAYFAVGQAAAARNGAQGAADAAALAAARDARDQLRDGLLAGLRRPDTWQDILEGKGLGSTGACAEAQRFAVKNRADVVDNDADGDGGCEPLQWPENGFTVEVRTRYVTGDSVIPGTEDQHAEARATAVVEPLCRFDPPDGHRGHGRGGNEDPNPDESEDHEKRILGLACDGVDLVVDPRNPGSFPDAADLFSVHLAG